jgi:hypothetical protein
MYRNITSGQRNIPDIGPNIDMLATQTGFEPVRLFRCCVSEELSELKRRVSSFR